MLFKKAKKYLIPVQKSIIKQETLKPWKQFWQQVKEVQERIVDLADTNQLEELKLILKNTNEALPFDINSGNGLNGWSAIFYAVFNDNIEMVKLLIQNGAKIQQINKAGSSLLHISVQIKSLPMTQFLLVHNVPKDNQDLELNTALHIAAQNNNDLIIEALLKAGCNPSIKNQQMLQPVLLVTEAKTLDVFQEFGINTTSPSKRKIINNKVIMISQFDTKLKILNSCKIKGICGKRYEKENCEGSIVLKNLQFVTKLGQGTFGEVYKVYDSQFEEFYALKCIEKKKVLNNNGLKYIMTEKQILSKMNSKYIVQFKGSFQNEGFLFILEEYISGQDLHKYLEQWGDITEPEAAKFIVQVAKALEDLHQEGYIYRDLKPHNVMVMPNGKIKLVDFGLCKLLVNEKTHSFCGSTAYLAPEMLTRSGHDKTIDFYLLGVLLYEMLHGKPPFYQYDKVTLFNSIVYDKIKFKESVSMEAQSLIQNLMNRNPKSRPTFKEIMNHKFFSALNFTELSSLPTPKTPCTNKISILIPPPFIFKQKANDRLEKWDWNIIY